MIANVQEIVLQLSLGLCVGAIRRLINNIMAVVAHGGRLFSVELLLFLTDHECAFLFCQSRGCA